MGGLGGVQNGCKRGRGIATRHEQVFFCFRGVSGAGGGGGGGGGGDTSSASQDQR